MPAFNALCSPTFRSFFRGIYYRGQLKRMLVLRSWRSPLAVLQKSSNGYAKTWTVVLCRWWSRPANVLVGYASAGCVSSSVKVALVGSVLVCFCWGWGCLGGISAGMSLLGLSWRDRCFAFDICARFEQAWPFGLLPWLGLWLHALGPLFGYNQQKIDYKKKKRKQKLVPFN